MQAEPRVPLTEEYVRAWHAHDGVGFLRLWATGEVPQGAHVEHSGNRVAEVPGPGSVVMTWTPTPALTNLTGGVHGGYIALVCDEAAGLAAASTGERFSPMVTLDLDVVFLRPALVGQPHRVEGEVLHAGRQRLVCEARIRTPEGGKLVATARGAFVPNPTFAERLAAARTARS